MALIHVNGNESRIASPNLPFRLTRPLKIGD
jgi:hypothetical protein